MESLFSGDWGDPFDVSGVDLLIGENAKQLGTETVTGFSARVLEASEPNGKTRLWVDTETGMIVRLQMIPRLEAVNRSRGYRCEPNPAAGFKYRKIKISCSV